MDLLIVKNDFKRNKIINFTLLLFMIFSACLAIMSIIMGVQTYTSISDFYEQAEPPHFLQMHKGEIDQEKLNKFMSNYQGLNYWQLQTMINIYGENLTIVGNETYDISDLRLDISLVKQNEDKDLLLDAQHNKIILNKGQIGIPVLLKNMYNMEVGDKVVLSSDGISKEFTIKEFVLDSQMNSPMTSSTRILLSDEEFEDLKGQIGEQEYLIEAYFTDTNEASSFQSAYESANLPINGPAITYGMIFLLSALTDIVMVFVLLLVSFLLIAISFICVKFTINAALEEEIYEIGTMKAIGLSFIDIRNIYLTKYRILAIIGVVIGYILAILFSGIFSNHISETFGGTSLSLLSMILSLLVGLLVYILIIHYCKKMLKNMKNITVVDALVNGNGFNKNYRKVKDGLYKSKLAINWALGAHEVFNNFRSYFIIFAVVLIAVIMILIPINLMNTMEAPEFVTYMGSSLEDILIEVESGENLENNYIKAKEVLEKDEDIENYYEYSRVKVQTTNVEGQLTNINIDKGNYSGKDLQYLRGMAPEEKNHIALSYSNAEKVGKDVGDKIMLSFNNKKLEFEIFGIYQDVTDGGYTAKSIYDFPGASPEKYTFSVNLKDNSNVEDKADELSQLIGTGVSVEPMEEFLNQTLGGVVNQLKTIVLVISIISGFMAILITILFLKLRLAQDQSEIAILKAVGFTYQDISLQFMIKIGIISTMGILAGVIISNLLGGNIVNFALSISGLGIKKVQLINNLLVNYIVCPVLLLLLILFVTKFMMKSISKYDITSMINE